jgi:hypothetical protein
MFNQILFRRWCRGLVIQETTGVDIISTHTHTLTSITSALWLKSKISLSSIFSFQFPSHFFFFFCITVLQVTPNIPLPFCFFLSYMSVTTPHSLLCVRHFLFKLPECKAKFAITQHYLISISIYFSHEIFRTSLKLNDIK